MKKHFIWIFLVIFGLLAYTLNCGDDDDSTTGPNGTNTTTTTGSNTTTTGKTTATWNSFTMADLGVNNTGGDRCWEPMDIAYFSGDSIMMVTKNNYICGTQAPYKNSVIVYDGSGWTMSPSATLESGGVDGTNSELQVCVMTGDDKGYVFGKNTSGNFVQVAYNAGTYTVNDPGLTFTGFNSVADADFVDDNFGVVVGQEQSGDTGFAAVYDNGTWNKVSTPGSLASENRFNYNGVDCKDASNVIIVGQIGGFSVADSNSFILKYESGSLTETHRAGSGTEGSYKDVGLYDGLNGFIVGDQESTVKIGKVWSLATGSTVTNIDTSGITTTSWSLRKVDAFANNSFVAIGSNLETMQTGMVVRWDGTSLTEFTPDPIFYLEPTFADRADDYNSASFIGPYDGAIVVRDNGQPCTRPAALVYK